jgi:hypothetical protein
MTLEGALDAAVEGDRVAFTFTVTNDGDEPVELEFRDSGKADITIREGDGSDGVGAERWRWSDGRMFAQVIQHEALAPGETAAYGFEWPDPVPGSHAARATLRAHGHDCEARTEFSV